MQGVSDDQPLGAGCRVWSHDDHEYNATSSLHFTISKGIMRNYSVWSPIGNCHSLRYNDGADGCEPLRLKFQHLTP